MKGRYVSEKIKLNLKYTIYLKKREEREKIGKIGKIRKIGLFYKVSRGAESSDRFPF